jgi:hypothetical protein
MSTVTFRVPGFRVAVRVPIPRSNAPPVLIRVLREPIVDSRVVAMLGNRDEYVHCLVDLSGHDLAPHFSQAGAGMLRPRELRARVDAIFSGAHMSRVLFATAALAFVAVIAPGLAVSAATPMRSAPIVLESSESLESHESRESARQSQSAASLVRLNPATGGPAAAIHADAAQRRRGPGTRDGDGQFLAAAGTMVEGRVQLRATRSRESEPFMVALFTDDGQTHLATSHSN